jgi:hypothetical protein
VGGALSIASTLLLGYGVARALQVGVDDLHAKDLLAVVLAGLPSSIGARLLPQPIRARISGVLLVLSAVLALNLIGMGALLYGTSSGAASQRGGALLGAGLPLAVGALGHLAEARGGDGRLSLATACFFCHCDSSCTVVAGG